MQEHTASVETKFEDLAEHNLNLLDSTLKELTQQMHEQFARNLYKTVLESCQAHSQLIDGKNSLSVIDAFIEGIEKVEFTIGKNGEVELPQIHASPEVAKALIEAEKYATPEQKLRLEEIQSKKTEQAKEREKLRREKFAAYGE